MTDTTEITYDEVSGRTRFANYRDGKLVSLFWKEAPGKQVRKPVSRHAMLDQKGMRD